MSEATTDKLLELAKRRGYFFRTAAAYGGVGGFYTFGPQGASLKDNVENAWRERFALGEGYMEIDAPTIMPEPVFEASGHLDGFDDMLIECPECGETHRVDHLIEAETTIEDAEGIPIPEIESLVAEHAIVCPDCTAGLAGQAVEAFNLMFETSIGPGDAQPGYLRPETAQGIFVEFPRLKEYARNTLPFGVTQIGRAYRNEISQRRSIVRTREFTQAELEVFVDPETVDWNESEEHNRDVGGDESELEPDLSQVADVTVTLYPVTEQATPDGAAFETTIGAALTEGIIDDRWIAYFLGVATEWYDDLGVDMDRFRYRQHQAGERAHYATDCWDAETLIGAGGGPISDDGNHSNDGYWIEIAGFANRGCYDLSKHAEYSGERFSVFREYDEPKTIERATVDPDMSALGPRFGADASDVVAELEAMANRDRSLFEDETVTVQLDGEDYDIPLDEVGFTVEEETIAGEHVVPMVIEPSFGIDRTVYTLLEHAYREDVIDDERRTYLALEPTVAPTFVGVFPLQRDEALEACAKTITDELRETGLSVTYDESGNIGRRYRRQDEVGTPFCVTVDYESLDDDAVTVRERDTTAQHRVPIDELPAVLTALRSGEQTFDSIA